MHIPTFGNTSRKALALAMSGLCLALSAPIASYADEVAFQDEMWDTGDAAQTNEAEDTLDAQPPAESFEQAPDAPAPAEWQTSEIQPSDETSPTEAVYAVEKASPQENSPAPSTEQMKKARDKYDAARTSSILIAVVAAIAALAAACIVALIVSKKRKNRTS